MGPSPPSSSQPPQSRPSPLSSSLPNFLSAADDWLLQVSDRDTQILTQALTRELSSHSRGTPALSSLVPSSATSSSSLYENFSRCLQERPLQSRSFGALRAVQQQQQQQQQQLNYQQQQQQQREVAMSSMWHHGDGFSLNSLQKGSPLSSNSSPPLSASAEAPASPFSSTVSTNSAISNIATDSFLAHSKPSNPQHHDSQDRHFTHTMASSLKSPEGSSVYSDSSLASKTASIALSSQASVGAGGGKVNKRRSRASCKAPIAVLSADTSNFRAMVQQLTGIPSASSIHSLAPAGIPLLKPQPIRHCLTNALNLPTLDTSACFLGPKGLREGFSFAQRPNQFSASSSSANSSPYAGVDLSSIAGRHVYDNSIQSHMPPHVNTQSVLNDQAKSINYGLSSSLPSCWDAAADSLKARGNFPSLHEGEQVSVRQNASAAPAATLDSLLMEEHSVSKSSINTVDSWLSYFDGSHVNHASNLEIARMA